MCRRLRRSSRTPAIACSIASCYRRLIPLGCVRAAIDDEDKLCIARDPRLDMYFGRKVALADLAPPPEAAGRVVVQPDFSVIVMGLNPASVAELTPFCERKTKTGSHGATVLKITREVGREGGEPGHEAGRHGGPPGAVRR